MLVFLNFDLAIIVIEGGGAEEREFSLTGGGLPSILVYTYNNYVFVLKIITLRLERILITRSGGQDECSFCCSVCKWEYQ